MDRRKIRERAKGRCEYCRAPECVAGYSFMVDHILPRSREGGEDPANLALSCWCCNLFKSDSIDGVDPYDGKRVLLFHPRRQKWKQHFRWNEDFTRIEGITTGRATVASLQMNSNPDRSEARRLWHAAGYLP